MNASHTLIVNIEVKLHAALRCKPELQGSYFHSSNTPTQTAQIRGAFAVEQLCSNIISFKV